VLVLALQHEAVGSPRRHAGAGGCRRGRAGLCVLVADDRLARVGRTDRPDCVCDSGDSQGVEMDKDEIRCPRDPGRGAAVPDGTG
jgi:hypothetical protein